MKAEKLHKTQTIYAAARLYYDEKLLLALLLIIQKVLNVVPKYSCTGLYILSFFIITSSSVFAEQRELNQTKIQGHVDSVMVRDDKIIVQGWVGSKDSKNKIESLSIWLADVKVYEGKFKQFDRPDVVRATGRKDWLKSGWNISFKLQDNLANGPYQVRVLAALDNGVSSELAVNDNLRKSSARGKTRAITKAILIALLVLLCFTFWKAEHFANWMKPKTGYTIQPSTIFGLLLFLSFVACVTLGLTGSSLNIGLKQNNYVESNVVNILGHDQPIRSDEWLVSTPYAIAQYNHQPQFPIVNTNLGEEGQNMLIVGMAGSPVAHITTIAKPATWGFFLFDLKRALSWHWCFPIFACLFALWGVINILILHQWRSSFIIALLFSVSPYVAAWSNWPSYAVFFPSLALLTSIYILKSKQNIYILTLGCVLGISLAGFVLVLYPPWQVSLGYLFLVMTVAIIIRDKAYKELTKIKLLSFSIGAIIFCLILYAWWQDAYSAIHEMMSTVYPGKRTNVTGGDIVLSGLLRGFTNLFTLRRLSSPFSNQCEIASFFYMLLPLFFLFVLKAYQKTIGVIEVALVFFICFVLFFMMIGVPAGFSQLSLWGRVPAKRADLALGLSSIILCGVLLSKPKHNAYKLSLKISALLVSSAWGIIVISSILSLHASIRTDLNKIVLLTLFFVIVASGYLLASSKFREFFVFNLVISIIVIAPFNPVNIAPQNVSLLESAKEIVFDKSIHNKERILVLETQIPAMSFFASGLPVANGIFYYPQNLLWQRLDEGHIKSDIYNRYQHLFFSSGTVDNKQHYYIESPSTDVVKVIINLKYFDFHKTSAQLIVAPDNDENALKNNSTLSFIKKDKGWSWFRLKGGSNGI